MRRSLSLGAPGGAAAPSESDIVGPNLQQAIVTGDCDAVGALPVHRPEIQIRGLAPQLAVSPPPVAGHFNPVTDDEVPGCATIHRHQAQDAAPTVWSSGPSHHEAAPFVEGVER